MIVNKAAFTMLSSIKSRGIFSLTLKKLTPQDFTSKIENCSDIISLDHIIHKNKYADNNHAVDKFLMKNGVEIFREKADLFFKQSQNTLQQSQQTNSSKSKEVTKVPSKESHIPLLKV